MSGVVLDVPVPATQPRSFLRLLWAVFVGSLLASVIALILALSLNALGWLPQQNLYPRPFPVDGAWSLAADVGVAATLVLVATWSIRLQIEYAVRNRVSFGVVVLAVAVAGYAPFVALGNPRFLGILTLPAITWIIRRYAIGTKLPFPTLSWRVWAALAVVAFGIFASYGVYHPLTVEPLFAGIDARASGTYSFVVPLKNPGLADVTILGVGGGGAGLKLPYTLKARSQTDLGVFHKGCASPDVTITYSVLGRTSSQRFTVGSLSSCERR